MPPSTRQKAEMLEQFMELTNRQMDRTTAQKMLKNAGYSLEAAFDVFTEQNVSTTAPIEAIFDQLRDPKRDSDKDTMEAESMMGYLEQMGVNGENHELFVLLEIVKAPGFGIISRKGFVDGWKDTTAQPTMIGHKKYVRDRIQQLTYEPDLFRKVYRYAFVAGKDKDQKALQTDRALVFWDMLLADNVHPWRSETVAWLPMWKRFLEEKYARPTVNRDMWNQLLEFANKSMDDEKLSFWNEDAAWPSVIDDFVRWVKSGAGSGGDGMQVD